MMSDSGSTDRLLALARDLASRGEDDAAKSQYLDVLRRDPTHFAALNELGALAAASGHLSAARTAYGQAVRYHAGNVVGHVNLGNLLLQDDDAAGARSHYLAALAVDPEFPQAHQGLARALTELRDPSAEEHWIKGFSGHAIVTKPYRGTGTAIPILLLVSARGGNIRTDRWINDRRFTITAVYTEFHDSSLPLPEHRLVFNAIGDAELCQAALDSAVGIVATTTMPVINLPEAVQATGRMDNARRLAGIQGVIAPKISMLPRAAEPDLPFPFLLRAPGFHTGHHFHFVETRGAMTDVAATLPGDCFLAIEYLNCRGIDGMARKYRVMFIDGALYPLHLAISMHWKVHYFSAHMRENPAFQQEERRFLEDMPAVLGNRAMSALNAIGASLGLDYAGVDFALAPDGSLVLFEANATMVVIPPDPDPIWDYRRRAVTDVDNAVSRMLSRRMGY